MRAASTSDITMPAIASPSAAFTASSRPASIVTRSTKAPTTPETSFRCCRPARLRAASSASRKTSTRALQWARCALAIEATCVMESNATSAAERRSDAPPTWFSKSSAVASAFSYSLPNRSTSFNKRSARSSSCAIRVLTRCNSARSRSSLLCKVRNSPRTSAAALAATGTGNSGSASSPSASRRASKSEICKARSSASGDRSARAESISSSSLRNAEASVSSEAITSESMN